MKQRHTLIIGGTRGLGRVVSRMLSAEGHNVSVLARNKPEGVGAVFNDVFYIQADLLDEKTFLLEISRLIKVRGKIHNLVFIQRFRGGGDAWNAELEISLNATRKIIEHLKDELSGDAHFYASITIVSSVAGKLVNNSQPLSYSIAKAGLNCMIRYYSVLLGPMKIRVNGVSPITFVKEESEKFYYEDNKELVALYEKIVPLGRMCTSEDVANVISFLCSEKAAFVNGQNIEVDGGLSVVSQESLSRELASI